MAVRDTLNRIENLVASASHLPLTGKAVIEEEDLVKLVEDLRRDLPQELEQAEKIMQDKDNIIRMAQDEADKIIKQARLQAEQLVDENETVMKAREKARMILTEVQQQQVETMERTRVQAQTLQDQADAYANQVFDQLITHVTSTFQGVQNAVQGLEQARQILQQAKIQMNQQAAQNSYAQQVAQNFQGPPPGYNQPQQPMQ